MACRVGGKLTEHIDEAVVYAEKLNSNICRIKSQV